MKFEKCNFEEATHIMLADGVTVRDITRIGYGCFKIANDTANQRVLDARLFGATFVRPIDDPPIPWTKEYTADVGELIIPVRFIGHLIRVHIEVIK